MRDVKTRFLSLLLAAALLLAANGGALAAGLPDTLGLDCDEAVSGLIEVGVVGGWPDGTYKPERLLTRAEAAQMMFTAFGLTADQAWPVPADVKGHWAESAVSACLASGVFSVDAVGLFVPGGEVSYGELCGYLLGGLVIGGAAVDVQRAVSLAGELGIGAGVQATDGPVTRGVASIMLYNAIRLPFVDRVGDAFIKRTDGVTRQGILRGKMALESGDTLRSFALAAYYEDNMINAASLAAEPAAYLWSASYGAFVPARASLEAVKYNFVMVRDTDGDKLGDALFIVNRADSEKYWDSKAVYKDPRGAEDRAYEGTWSNGYNIPFGERLIGFADEEGYLDFSGAAMDYHNIAAPGDMSASTYYPTYDWYNSTGTDTLTMLTGFKTIQQTTGWACGVTSALMTMDWFGLRGDLNELDLGALRNTKEKYGAYRWGSSTDVKMLLNVFSAINEMEGREVWRWESTYDFVDADGNLSDEYLSTGWIQGMLAQGRPIMVGWNSFGGHWQVIIGYDGMGTENTADDVLILADPYDTTDHRNDGVNIQSYQRLYYDWTQNFDRDFGRDKGFGMTVMFAPYPVVRDEYKPVSGKGLAVKKGEFKNRTVTRDAALIPYGDTAKDLAASDYKYAKEQAGSNGMAGPASSDYMHMFECALSPYYPVFDFFGGEGLSGSLTLLKGFKTSQQASEWTCGPASARMVLNWFGEMGSRSEFALAHLRENDKEGATTLDGMAQIFEGLSAAGQSWGLLTTDDMDEDGSIGQYNLYEGASYGGLIPYCLKNGIPIMIGWNEWGGHWQVIIGYDDMGTEETQDDVLILADPYDTTDHVQDGYVVESFERLVYGWGAAFDERGSEVFVIAAPQAKLAAAGLLNK